MLRFFRDTFVNLVEFKCLKNNQKSIYNKKIYAVNRNPINRDKYILGEFISLQTVLRILEVTKLNCKCNKNSWFI